MEQMPQINVGGLRVEKSWALPPSTNVSPGEAMSLLSKLHVRHGSGASEQQRQVSSQPSLLGTAGCSQPPQQSLQTRARRTAFFFHLLKTIHFFGNWRIIALQCWICFEESVRKADCSQQVQRRLDWEERPAQTPARGHDRTGDFSKDYRGTADCPETLWDEGVLRGEADFLHSSGVLELMRGMEGCIWGWGALHLLVLEGPGTCMLWAPQCQNRKRPGTQVGLLSSTICLFSENILNPRTRSNIEKPKPCLIPGQGGLPRSAAEGLAMQGAVHSIWERGQWAVTGNSASPGVRDAPCGAVTSPWRQAALGESASLCSLAS